MARIVAYAAAAVAGVHAATPWPPAARAQAQALLAQMTQAEKIVMAHGNGFADGTFGYVGSVPANTRLNIPLLGLEDGPQGVADLVTGVTAWPSALTVAMTWDPALAFAWGEAMGAEQAGKGANVMLGPGVNLARVPWGGRNFEYLGEDPVLASVMVAAEVRGIQSNNISACVKHFVMNNFEQDRSGASANVGSRPFFEQYLKPFAAAVDAGVGSAMCSYNRVNNTWACENPATLGALKGPLGFAGWVMSDWGATHSTIPSALGGLDQEMPDQDYFGAGLAAAVANGSVPQSRLDDMVLRQLTAMYALGMMTPLTGNLSSNVTSAAHVALTRQLADESATLLKNDGALLPLDASKLSSIALMGDQVIYYGQGSGGVLPPYYVSPYEAIFTRANGVAPAPRSANCTTLANTAFNQPGASCLDLQGTEAVCADYCGQDPTCNGYTFVANRRCNGWGNDASVGSCYFIADTSSSSSASGSTSGVCTPAPPSKGSVNVLPYAGYNSTAAAAIAAAADVAVISVAITCSEGNDRANLSVPQWQDDLVAAVAAVQPNTIVFVRCAGPCVMPWASSVRTIIYQLMPGQETAASMAAILFGDVNPSGKLPMSFPNNMTDTWLGNPVNPQQYPGTDRGKGWPELDYSEGLFFGYRWYDAQGTSPLWCFGHGLSYTTFAYSNLVVSGSVSPASNASITVQLTNNGTVAGAEVVQLYVSFPPAAAEPPKLLKAFAKTPLAAGAGAPVSFTLSTSDLTIWDLPTASWIVVPGTYGVQVGTSSCGIKLTGSVTVTA